MERDLSSREGCGQYKFRTISEKLGGGPVNGNGAAKDYPESLSQATKHVWCPRYMHNSLAVHRPS
jgi:hypothetical protein